MKKDVMSKLMLATTAILIAASMALAKFPRFDFGHSPNKAKNIQIFQTGRIPGGPTLPSGQYRVVLNDNSNKPEIEFYQSGKLVAQVPAKVVNQANKNEQTEIFYDTRSATPVIMEMDLGGWRDKIFFGQNNGDARLTK